MGEVYDENYLKVDILTDTVEFILVPLNNNVEMHPIVWYNIPETPIEIIGPDKITLEENEIKYKVAPVFNATNYRWELSGGLSGNSDSSVIFVDFESMFNSGTISVSAINDGFGESESISMEIIRNEGTTIDERNLNLKFQVLQNGKFVNILFNSKISVRGLLHVYNTAGALLYFNEVRIDQGINNIEIGKNQLETGVLIFQVNMGHNNFQEKVLVNF